MEEILQKIRQEAKEPELISRAFNFAKKAHSGQKRFSGEEYIIHPLKVAQTISKFKLDSKTIAASLLHDVVDDTGTSLEKIEEEFGKEVAFLIEGVSKLGKIRYPKEPLEIQPIKKRVKKPIDLQAENLRKIFFAMAKDLRIILIKLADRLHNMETLGHVPKEKQKRLALETLEIFAPLADRLGIGEMKGKLEDLSFPYLYPKEYEWLRREFKEKFSAREKHATREIPILKKLLEKEGIEPLDIHARAKYYWSLYQKLLKYEMNIERIYDLVALRVIVKDVKDCYAALGAIHKHWRPLPGRIKDYIAFPKPNGYQSLHTTVICDEGKIIEIQIRTPEMHKEAEYGICAHWAEKEKISLPLQEKKFEWTKQLEGWQNEILSNHEFLEGLKIDFFKNRIFVFTPKGDVIDLPEGATPIDFAYHVHTDIGNHCVGAKVNGKMVAVSTTLKNGEVVEILVDKNKVPSRDWLKFAKTNLARSHIKKEIKKGFLEALTERISPKRIVREILKKKKPEVVVPTPVFPKIEKPLKNVIIGGESRIYFSFAKCCNPQAGEKIKAYITKNKGASIHKMSCESLKRNEKKWPEKVIEAGWEK